MRLSPLLPRLVAALAASTLIAAGCSPQLGLGGALDTGDEPCVPRKAPPTCPVWTVRCGDECVDLTINPAHCGGCFVACGPTEQCRAGVCVATTTRCGALPAEATAGLAIDRGLAAEYYATEELTTLRLVRSDDRIDFDWTMKAPDARVPREHFSARWRGRLTAPATGTYTITADADDGVRVIVGGQTVVDAWTPDKVGEHAGQVGLEGGHTYALRVEYRQAAGPAALHLSWSGPGIPREIIPAERFTPPATAQAAWQSCDGGSCCEAGGVAACCPAGARCVQGTHFRGCCPAGQTCDEPAGTCGAP